MTTKPLIALSVVAAFALPIASQAQTTSTVVLLDENFDSVPTGLSLTDVGLFHTINGTNVDVVGPGFPTMAPNLCRAPASGHCVDMNGSGTGAQATLVSNQTFTLKPANTYTLTYDLVGSGRNSNGLQIPASTAGVNAQVTASFGNDTKSLNEGPNGTRQNQTVLMVDTQTTSPLSFMSDTAGNIGLLLDNVKLTCTGPTCLNGPSPVPEPATFGLLTLGLLGAGFSGRRHRT